jgi:hypothetical protein
MINNPGQTNLEEFPLTAQGRWDLISLDKINRTAIVTHEVRVSGVIYEVYKSIIPFGPSVYNSQYSNNPEATFALGYAALDGRASIMRDPCQSIVNDDIYMLKYPPDLKVPDPWLSERTVRLKNQMNTPNFGRTVWEFASQTGLFACRFKMRISNNTNLKFFKIGNTAVTATPGPRIDFSGGNINVYNAGVATTVRTYTGGVWMEFDIYADASTDKYEVWIDGVLEATNFSFVNNQTALKAIEIGGELANIYVDNLRIEKYIVSGPAITSVSA